MGLYVGVDNIARTVKKIYVGIPTQVPTYEGGGTIVPLTVANLDKFFTVSKTCGELAGDFTDYFTINSDACGSSQNYNSAWGTFDTLDVYSVCIFSVTATEDMNSVSLSISNAGGAMGYIDVDGTMAVAIGENAKLDSSCDVSITSGSTIDVYVLMTSSAGDSISFEIINNDATAAGTSSDWTLSDESDGGVKLAPGIFGEPLTYCAVELTAKTAISDVVLSGRYYTESGCDLLTVKINDAFILNEAAGDSGLSERWSGNLAAGDKLYFYYTKDGSVDNSAEADTAFFISCNPIIEGTITGYEVRPVARKVKKIYSGVDGIARLSYSAK